MNNLRWIGLAVGVVGVLGLLGCEVDSPDSVVREGTLYVQGFYQHPEHSETKKVPIVRPRDGYSIYSFDIRQTGDQLEAIDNYGIVFRGAISRSGEDSATFTLTGRTTAGKSATISGTFEKDGSKCTMQGTWIEEDYYSTVYAQATVPPSPGGGGGGATPVSISPTNPTLTTNGASITFNASGGSGSYTWSVSDSSRGQLSSTSGSSVTYTRLASGNVVVTVRDASNPQNAASTTVTQP